MARILLNFVANDNKIMSFGWNIGIVLFLPISKEFLGLVYKLGNR